MQRAFWANQTSGILFPFREASCARICDFWYHTPAVFQPQSHARRNSLDGPAALRSAAALQPPFRGNVACAVTVHHNTSPLIPSRNCSACHCVRQWIQRKPRVCLRHRCTGRCVGGVPENDSAIFDHDGVLVSFRGSRRRFSFFSRWISCATWTGPGGAATVVVSDSSRDLSPGLPLLILPSWSSVTPSTTRASGGALLAISGNVAAHCTRHFVAI